MLSKAIIFIISLFILSSCSTGPEGYFKRSANNKLFDRSGFKGKKRAPLYNKKYIAKAKQNVVASEYDEEEDLDDELMENENISKANRDMYREMLEQEVESRYLGKKRNKNTPYPSVIRTNPMPNDTENTNNTELRAELEHIKTMLNETKNEMASYRCPTAKELEKVQAKTRETENQLDQQKSNGNVTIIDPVKSI